MPELPEVETIARGLAKRVTGDAIESVWLGQKKEPLKSTAQEIAAVLEHSRISRVHRMGKHIVFELELTPPPPTNRKKPPRKVRLGEAAGNTTSAVARGGARPTHSDSGKAQWIVHLGMTGRLQVCEPSAEVEKHTHAVVKLESGRELRFVDPRRFGRLSVAATGEFDTAGIEPLEIDLEKFISLFRGRKTPMKSALLNQKLLRGVGNIYADESLFRAGIRPRRKAASVTRGQLGKLFVAIQEVLTEAIALGGSSISDYVDADGEEGFFQLQHRVYGREGEPCLVCKTPIKRVVIAGRSSHYCPKCQK
ncbi:MAG TPA: bifunctional DNA-formamidopyrimidine glycosylase/DNA-(apurinic or apyrimidinic site) lyase [Candidatus Eisenbacteria bacterium]|nr:bifunctional DNA-formamidopyrimidine glycosylase/DNA-(apurinic or apyrimidinic site) lyase [Candidatus Eisenbacteria bacterium]